MTVSQNGYKFGDGSLIATYTVVRDVKLSLLKGDASVVLLHLARWFDKNIEPLKKAQCGGYNPRSIGNSQVRSNHGSGTAEDLNWGEHVQGKKNTFTAAEQKKIRAQLKFYEGVIRWGGDYTKTVDDMHFEINKGPTELAHVAKKCRADDAKNATPKPPITTPAPPKPQPKPAAPKPLVVDGKLGPNTITRWQQVMGTPVDGEIDEKGSALIEAVQRRLNALHIVKLTVDGRLGRHTIAGIQRYLKSPVDGVISPKKSQMVVALQRRLNTGKF